MSIPRSERELASAVDESSREAEFLRQLARNYRELYALATTIVGSRNDAEDVIQEVCVVLWKKRGEFEEIVNFRKWARTVVLNVARSYARKQRRRRGAGLDDQTLDRMVKMRLASCELLELRREVLRSCLDKLPSPDWDFLMDCYSSSTSLAELASQKGRTASTIYSKLKRLRRALVNCVQRHLERGDA
ncbi:MAG TPA: sigma-70 family RNA polymerase sigma factor [Planctomicrobium sp.]|nr:sigma-70 family RNA polymerase sigma factor [Planctomicrobium sp.]